MGLVELRGRGVVTELTDYLRYVGAICARDCAVSTSSPDVEEAWRGKNRGVCGVDDEIQQSSKELLRRIIWIKKQPWELWMDDFNRHVESKMIIKFPSISRRKKLPRRTDLVVDRIYENDAENDAT